MSTFEYNDSFVLSQDSGRYHVYTFDIVNSKKMDAEVRKIAQEKINKTNDEYLSINRRNTRKIKNTNIGF